MRTYSFHSLNKLLLVGVFFVFLFSPFFVSVNAQEQKGVIIAAVGIYDARILTQAGGEITYSFDIKNEIGTQGEIYYGIQLRKNDGDTRGIPDHETLTDKAITLSSGEIVSIKDTITIPSFINGNYLLSVVSRNKNGLFLASRDAGVISLNGSGESVFINPNSCTLTSNDSTPNSSLLSRIKVEKGDVITLTCSTENQGLQSISVIPHVETFSGSVFGEGKTTEQLLGNSITLLGGYKKTSSIKIKAEGNPHDYTAVVSFVSGGKKISNSINVNYKILGEQAKIMNIILDKDSYKKEDIANISILWKSDIEDLKSKLYLNLLIKNSESENCIEPIIRKPISNTKSLEIVLDVPIINDCLNPEVSVQIIDDNGYVMDESSFLMESNLSNKSISIYLYASVVVLILLIFGFVFVKRKNNGPNNIDNINVQ